MALFSSLMNPLTQAGLAASNIPGDVDRYSQNADGSYNTNNGLAAALGGGSLGALVGGGLGYLGSKRLKAMSINRAEKDAELVRPYLNATGGINAEAPELLKNKGLLKKVQGIVNPEEVGAMSGQLNKFKQMAMENPAKLGGLGAMLGMTLGASVVGKALQGQSNAQYAQQQDYWTQKNAMDNQRALMQAYPQAFSPSSGGGKKY